MAPPLRDLGLAPICRVLWGALAVLPDSVPAAAWTGAGLNGAEAAEVPMRSAAVALRTRWEVWAAPKRSVEAVLEVWVPKRVASVAWAASRRWPSHPPGGLLTGPWTMAWLTAGAAESMSDDPIRGGSKQAQPLRASAIQTLPDASEVAEPSNCSPHAERLSTLMATRPTRIPSMASCPTTLLPTLLKMLPCGPHRIRRWASAHSGDHSLGNCPRPWGWSKSISGPIGTIR